MRLRKLFQTAFEEGCGVSFSEILHSAQLREYIAHELSLSEKYPEDTDQGYILRMSPISVAIRANETYQEVESTPMRPAVYSRRALIERAFIRLLGEKLVEAGKAQLPDEAIALAEEFKGGDRDQKHKTALKVFRLFMKINAEIDPEKHSSFDEDDYRRCLPLQFGRYGSSEKKPVCLGVAIMLVAWARLAEAEVMLANMLHYPVYSMWASEGDVSQKLLSDIESRGLIVDEDFSEALRENIAKASAMKGSCIDFHAAVSIHIEQSPYTYLDPYCGYYGFMSNKNWHLYVVDTHLNYLKEIVPGATIVGHDSGFFRRWLRKRKEDLCEAIEKSSRLEEAMPGTESATLFREFLDQSEEFAYLVVATAGCLKISKPRARHKIEKTMFGWKSNEKVSEEKLLEAWDKFEKYPVFRDNSKRRLLGLFHRVAKFDYSRKEEKLRIRGEDVPAYLEFTNPEFGLALQVLNNLNCWSPAKSDLGLFFIKHSSSQIFWHEALAAGLKPGKLSWDSRMLWREAMRHIRFIDPLLHRQCALRLKKINRKRKVVKQDD